MVGHVKEGYQGYNSTPSSPTKYTVNAPQRAGTGAGAGSHGTWIVTNRCIFATALAFALALLVVFLLAYYLPARKCPLEGAATTNGFGGGTTNASQIDHPPTSVNCTLQRAPPPPPVVPPNHVFNLTDDVIDIETMPNDDTKSSMATTEGDEAVVSSSPKFEEVDEPESLRLHRLPRDVSPTQYRLKIVPFPNNMTTSGDVSIRIRCTNATNQIRLHLKDITFVDEDVVVYSAHSNEHLEVGAIRHLDKYEQILIELSERLAPLEEYVIQIKYAGKIRSVPNGLYKSEYTEGDEAEKKWILNTLFSPSYARYVFPSFDEPSFKATFFISLGRPLNMMTFSNMNMSRTEPIQGLDKWVWDHYHETPVMSTYLTAFLIAPRTALMKNKAERARSPEIKVWARPDGIYKTRLALTYSERILAYYEDYFNVSFPLPKIDIIGVPTHDYGAMENWGLITFKEDFLLVDKESSVEMQQGLVLTMAHEIAHQWFGNLVTPAWWEDLWLKEGLSSYFQCLSVDQIEPSWLVFDSFVLNEMNAAFQVDSLLSAPSVSRNVTLANKEIFDVITYNKASSLIWMLAKFLKPEALKTGLMQYLTKFKYSHADRDDLWDSLSNGEKFPYNDGETTTLKTIMDSWILQPGYPVVNVKRRNDSLILTQERFLYNSKLEVNDQLWWIPISYTTSDEKNFNNTVPKVWLAAKKEIEIREPSSPNKWILMNLKTSGFYRVNYDRDNWLLLIQNYQNFPPSTRAQLMSDALNLARAKKMTYDLAFALTNKLAQEYEYFPWQAAIPPLRYLRNSLVKMPVYGNFKKYLIVIMLRAYRRTNVDDGDVSWKIPEDPIEQLLTENIIGMTCLIGYSHCVANSLRLFDAWRISKDDNNIIPESIRHIVYCTAIREGSSKNWEFAYEKFRSASTKGVKFNNEKNNLVTALGCASEQWLLTKTLGLITQPNSGLTIEDSVRLFKSVARNNIGHWLAVSFIRNQWKELMNTYKNPMLVYGMVHSTVMYINSHDDVNMLKNLVNEIRNFTQEDSFVLRQALETAENNVIWMQNNYFSIYEWIEIFASDHKSSLMDME